MIVQEEAAALVGPMLARFAEHLDFPRTG